MAGLLVRLEPAKFRDPFITLTGATGARVMGLISGRYRVAGSLAWAIARDVPACFETVPFLLGAYRMRPATGPKTGHGACCGFRDLPSAAAVHLPEHHARLTGRLQRWRCRRLQLVARGSVGSLGVGSGSTAGADGSSFSGIWRRPRMRRDSGKRSPAMTLRSIPSSSSLLDRPDRAGPARQLSES
jgi:hypothetical protein